MSRRALPILQGIVLREYQAAVLRAIFDEAGTGRNAVVVMPCGGGKTVIGVTAITVVQAPSLVVVTNQVSADQWRGAILRHTGLGERDVRLYDCGASELSAVEHTLPMVLISTYAKLCHPDTAPFNPAAHPFALIILDEMHHCAATEYNRVLAPVTLRTQFLGLTATYVREDDRLDSGLKTLVPSSCIFVYTNWKQLMDAGYIARVQCVEITCENEEVKRRVLEALLRLHGRDGRMDKILVWCESESTAKELGTTHSIPVIVQGTTERTRRAILHQYNTNPAACALVAVHVLDEALDAPCANVGIQVEGHGASRRQHVQRAGRLSRLKPSGHQDSVFYSLVMEDGKEAENAAARRAYLTSGKIGLPCIIIEAEQVLQATRSAPMKRVFEECNEEEEEAVGGSGGGGGGGGGDI